MPPPTKDKGQSDEARRSTMMEARGSVKVARRLTMMEARGSVKVEQREEAIEATRSTVDTTNVTASIGVNIFLSAGTR
jgi:hypothetical protein